MKTRRKTGGSRKQQAAPRKRATVQRTSTVVALKAVPAPRKSAAGSRQAMPAPRKPLAASNKSATAARVHTQSAALAADCTIAQAGAIKKRLARVLGKPAPVTLDLSDVRRIDTAGLQVLAAFIRERRAAGRGVQCQGASESFLITANLLGLGALFSPVMGDLLSAPAAGSA
jgi:anti-anti-sigma regulatory factor